MIDFSARRRRQKVISDLNITNLIDVILTVLIIFMITAPMMTKDKEEDHKADYTKPESVEELKVLLPDPAISAGKSRDLAPISLGIDAQGAFYIGKNAAARTVMMNKLREIAIIDKGRHVRLEVDRRAPSGSLIELLDLFAYEGITDYAIHTLEGRYGDPVQPIR
jgi:biopolymer transport protein ExbD/biopolymer transport protein TolR